MANIFHMLGNFKTLRKYMLTNGSNLDYVKKLIKEQALDILAVSLDGATPEMSNSIRCGSDFDYITTKLSEITSMKDEGYKIPYINLVFVIMRRNVHQFPDMVRLAHKLGIPELKAVYLTSFDGVLEEETFWNHAQEYHAPLHKAQALAKELNVALKCPPVIGDDPAKSALHKDCFVAWRDLFVGSDGNVRPCQSSNHILGNISRLNSCHRDEFFNFWNCDQFQNFRSSVNDPQTMNQNCRVCYQSSHANWNLKHAHIQQSEDSIPDWRSI
jgi:MoaA/NifB/PqqE/SkfB family radical SAM enzyme